MIRIEDYRQWYWRKPATPPTSMPANFRCSTVSFNGSDCLTNDAYGLARLLAQQCGEFLYVLGEEVCELEQDLFPLLNRGIPPGWEGALRSGDGIVEILRVRIVSGYGKGRDKLEQN